MSEANEPAFPTSRYLPKPERVDETAYIIFYEDRDRQPETVFGTAAARKMFDDASLNWNAHLFAMIDTNLRDKRHHIAAQAAELAELKQRVEALETMSPTERDLEFQVNESIRLSDEIAELRAKLEAAECNYRESLSYIDAIKNTLPGEGLLAVRVGELKSQLAAAQACDDERPVDEEWLKANDFRHHNGLDAWMRDIANGNNIEVVISDHDGGVCAARDKPGYPVHIVQVVSGTPTIGQLRHLLAALGGAK